MPTTVPTTTSIPTNAFITLSSQPSLKPVLQPSFQPTVISTIDPTTSVSFITTIAPSIHSDVNTTQTSRSNDLYSFGMTGYIGIIAGIIGLLLLAAIAKYIHYKYLKSRKIKQASNLRKWIQEDGGKEVKIAKWASNRSLNIPLGKELEVNSLKI